MGIGAGGGKGVRSLFCVRNFFTARQRLQTEWLSKYTWYAYYDPQRGQTYAAHDTPTGRRVLMHNVIMGLDTLEEESLN